MTPEPHLSRLARGGALNLAGAASAGVCGVALVFAVAHGYPQSVAGAFFAATSLFVILDAVCGLGSDAGLLRWMPRQLALGDRAAARRTVPIALVPVVSLACVAGLVLAALAPRVSAAVGEAQVVPMLRILAAFLPVAAAHDLILAATRGHGTMRPTVAIEKMFRQAGQVGAVLIAPLLSPAPVTLALAWALPYLIGLLAAAVWYRRLAVLPTRSRSRSPSRPGGRPHTHCPADGRAGGTTEDGSVDNRRLARAFWRYTAPRAVAQVCQTALQRADIVLVAALASPRDAAIYTAATRFMVVGQLGTQAVQQAMQPAVSRLLALDDRAGVARVFSGCTTWTITLTWPVHLAVAVAAPLYLAAFGHGYAAGGQTATVILALAMLVATGTGPVDVMLLMAGRSGLSLANNLAALTADLLLDAVLIPRMGITGAAIGWAVALLIRNLLPVEQVRRLLRMTPLGAGLGLASVSTLTCFGALPLAGRLAFGTSAAAAGLVLGAACYAGLLWVGRDRLALTAFVAVRRQHRVADHA